MQTIEGSKDYSGITVAIVVARWNEMVTKQLLEGAVDTLQTQGVTELLVVHVPGAWEVPLAAKSLIEQRKADAVIALGCILQGATPHAGLLSQDVSSALMKLQMEMGVPISWGILTPETPEQALERAGLKLGNKGREAAQAALDAVALQRALRAGQSEG